MDTLRIIIYRKRINLSLNQNVVYTRVMFVPSGCCFNRRKMNPICILASCTKNDIALFSMKRYKCNLKILIMSCITRLDTKPLSWITTWFRLHELLIINFCFNRQCYFVPWTFYYLNIKTYYAYLELPNAIS